MMNETCPDKSKITVKHRGGENCEKKTCIGG
jgi:hypothetical protein